MKILAILKSSAVYFLAMIFILLLLIAKIPGIVEILNYRDWLGGFTEAIITFFDILIAWAMTPKELIANIAILIVSIAISISIIGPERILNSMKFLFWRDFRQAAFRKIIEDPFVDNLKKDLFAEYLLKNADWRKLDSMPRPKPNEAAHVARGGDGLSYYLSEYSRTLDRYKRVSESINRFSPEFSLELDEYIDTHKKDHFSRIENWNRVEDGIEFSSSEQRNQWHAIYAKMHAINLFREQFRQFLERRPKASQRALDRETLDALLKEFVDEMTSNCDGDYNEGFAKFLQGRLPRSS